MNKVYSTLKLIVNTTSCCILFFSLGFSNLLAQSNTWVQKSDIGYNTSNVPEPSPREGAVGFSIGSKGYIGTGHIGVSPFYTKDFWEYDPVTNVWTQKADFGGSARFAGAGFSIGTKGYLGLGVGHDYPIHNNDFWEYDQTANVWTQKADFGGAGRQLAVGLSIGAKGYFGTGYSINGSSETYYKDFWEYDPSTDKWAQKEDFGGNARYWAAGFSIDSKGYLGTGYDGSGFKKDFWEYDPVANNWTQKADFGGTARYQGVGFNIGSKGYLGIGVDDSYIDNKDFWEYDPTIDTWKQRADFAGTAPSDAVGFSIDGRGYIGTGRGGVNFDYLKDFWEYDPEVNNWTQKIDFGGTTGRAFAIGFSIESKGYLGTGIDNRDYSYKKDFWEYDPAANTWTQKADFGGGDRWGCTGFSIGSKGYVGTGADYAYHNDFWEYDPVANTWTQRADFGGAPRDLAVGFSIGAKGYIGTGDNDIYPYRTKDFWEYDPTTNTWTQKADFGGTARGDAAGFSIGSRGYIGMGVDISFYQVKDFWEYDPAANSWRRRADFGGIESQFPIGFSIGNKGYMGTGNTNVSPYYSKDFWEYDPATNTWTKKADLGGVGRYAAVGFNIGNKGYIGAGAIDYPNYNAKDFWEYTPGNTCFASSNLRVAKISDTCARLTWNIPDSSVEHIKVSYRKLGDSVWIEDRKKSLENSKVICGLTPNTTYEWKVRNICAEDKTGWVHGPNFTTTISAAFSLSAATANDIKIHGNISVQIMPNPNKGNFTIQMHLPNKAASTKLSLYNSLGEKVWQQDAGIMSGSVSKNIVLENKLLAGMFVLIIQHGDTRLMQKVVVAK